ncbi:hypothetical protein [Bacteroides reticulotermitis]|uniref:hypothetical protein n=1 Tax=Bacteroides reticulotermitis TaxID=1133319 RepID=UPI003A858CD5
MKQMKFFLATLAILISVSFTSCISNGDNNTKYTQLAIAKCTDYFPPTFVLASGQKLIVNDATLSDLSTGVFYAFYFQFDTAEQSPTASSINVTLYGGSTPTAISAKNEEQPAPLEDTDVQPANAPIHTLNGYASGLGQVNPAMYSDDYIIVPVVYWIKSETDETKMKEELAKHTFEMTYKKSEMKNGELVLTLNHIIDDGEVTEGKEVTRDKYTYTYKVYEIRNVINDFKIETGSAPTKVTIKAETNSNKNSLLEGATTQKASLDYPVSKN